MGLDYRIVFDLVDVMDGRCSLSQACIRDRRIPTLQVLPIAQRTGRSEVSPDAMRKVCDGLRPLCDYVIVDASPICTDGPSVVGAADEVVVVLTPSWHTVHYVQRLIKAVRSQHASQDTRLVINRWRPTDSEPCAILLKILQFDLLGVVPEDDYVSAYDSLGEFAALFPGSPAGQEYRNVARRILGEEVPFTAFGN